MCPDCGRTKIVKIPENIFQAATECEKGILAILIPENTICKHNFMIFVDRNFSVRDTMTTDHVRNVNKKKIINLNDLDDLVNKLSKKSIRRVLDAL